MLTYADDALRIAAAARRTPQMIELNRKPKRRRIQSSPECQESSTLQFGEPETKRLSNGKLAELHSEAVVKLHKFSGSTAARAIDACDKLSTRPISEGGLGPYFLSELFRRTGLDSRAASQNAPASFLTIKNLPVGQCDDSSTNCSICLKDLTGEVATLPCAHGFHTQCISAWLALRDSCPCCRAPVETLESMQAESPARTSQSDFLRSHLHHGELSLRVSQWDGMTHLHITALAMKVEPLVPVSGTRQQKHAPGQATASLGCE
jgi:hypothetical protein